MTEVTSLFCPCCGWPTDTAIQRFPRKEIKMTTCRHEGCRLWGATLSERTCQDPKVMAAWKVIPRFDPITGRELQTNATA